MSYIGTGGFDYRTGPVLKMKKMCKIVLNGLSGEMNLVEFGVIRQVFIES
jgi:hypothetical protein